MYHISIYQIHSVFFTIVELYFQFAQLLRMVNVEQKHLFASTKYLLVP